MSVTNLKKALKDKEITFGEKSVIKSIKLGKASVVFLSNDCKKNTKEAIHEYAKISKFEIVELDINAAEIGSLSKKQYSVSILCY
ncbi:MAG: ribosomal L7Ae/L30e/S12e/Gadd45 family protein [Nanoarchaeota archaeon]|nr:ribosomal L7Ae/L30e/S12e/Gadd45 family protein [Nanoarchaeota archaeon]